MADNLLTPAQERQLIELRKQAAIDKKKMTEEQLKQLKELQDLEQGIVDSAERRKEQLEEQIELLEEQITLNNKIKSIGTNVVGAYADQLELERLSLETRKQNLDASDREYEKTLKQLVEDQRSYELKKRSYQESENFIRKFTGITRDPRTGLSKFLLDPNAFTQGLSAGISEIVDSTSIMTSTVDKVVEASIALAVTQDQAVVNFRNATGATGEFDDNIRGLERSLFTAGVSTDDASKSVQSLFVNVSDFTMMSENQQKVLGKTVAVLNELGVSAETSTKNIQFAIKALGMTTNQAEKLQRDLLTFAKDLGVSVETIAADFQRSQNLIAALGTNGVDAFKRLEAQAKSTGMEFDSILSTVEKFNKFDTAAQSVGRLNALLGGPYLNTLELVAETDPAKRFEILKKRIDAAGLSFNSMDFYQRKALASAMGLNETQLAMLMRGNINKILPTTKSAEELEELAEQTAQFNTVMEELTQIGMGLAISFGPLVSMFKDFLQVIDGPLVGSLQGLAFIVLPVLISKLGALRIASTGIIGVMGAAARAAMVLRMTGIGLLIIAVMTLAEYIGPPGGELLIGIAAMTFAFFKMGLAANGAFGYLGLLIGIVMQLAYVFFVKTHSPGLITILHMVTAGFIAMGIAASIFGFSLAPVLPFILTFAAAMLMVGAGIGLAAGGMSLFVDSLTNFGTGLAESMTQTALAIQDIVESINELDTAKTVAIGAAMVPLAAAAPAASLAAAAAGAVGTFAGGEGAASGGVSGPPPVININLQIDGKEFATVVNDVSVERYSGGKPSEMYASIIGMIEQGFVRGV